MTKYIEDLEKKYGLIKYVTCYRWEVSGIEIYGSVLRVIKNEFGRIENIEMAKEINVVYWGDNPHIEHNLWIDVEFCDIEDKLIELKKQWNDAVMEMKEYKMKKKLEKMKKKLERIDGDF